MKIHHISEAGVSFKIVWSVDQNMGWRTHFLHMAANYCLKEVVSQGSSWPQGQEILCEQPQHR